MRTQITYGFCMGLLLTACSPEEKDSQKETTSPGSNNRVELTTEQLRMGSFQLGTLNEELVSTGIPVNGSVQVQPDATAAVAAKFSGTLKKINLLPGQQVRKGEVLFLLENPEFIRIEQDFLEAKAQLEALEAEYVRQKKLFEGKAGSEKNYLQAESDFRSMEVRYSAGARQLELMNIQADQLSAKNLTASIRITAPIDGIITDVFATQGQYLTAADPVVDLVNSKNIYLEFNVFEKHSSQLNIGDTLLFESNAYPGKQYAARLTQQSPVVRKDSKSMRWIAQIQGEHKELLPGMYISGTVASAATYAQVIPASAIVRDQNKSYVFVYEGEANGKHAFRKTEVTIVTKKDETVCIILPDGFRPEQQFLLSNALSMNAFI